MAEEKSLVVRGGPRTEEGKRRASMNALKHGLSARTIVLPAEDQTLWDAWERLFVDELQPVGAIEEFLARRVASCAWRLQRVERLEGAMNSDRVVELLRIASEAPPEGEGGSSSWQLPNAHKYDGLAKLARHETAIERAFYRALYALQTLQERRREAEADPPARKGFV